MTDLDPTSATVQPPFTLRLDEIAQEPVGGKAAGLARLIRLGLRVPPGFVVVGATPGHLPIDLFERYRALGAGRVAVRSSAIGEDSAEASFAGQYETVLGVEGEEALRLAVEACLSSLSSRRADHYARAQTEPRSPGGRPPDEKGPPDEQGPPDEKRPPDDKRMCVVVQRMVDPSAAGVLFTADPVHGRRADIVIDAVAGLADALVSGHVSPDHYILDRLGRTRREEPSREAPLLSESQRSQLVEEALVAEKADGRPLDLEWAIDREGVLHWLQARPITRLGADPNELDTPVASPDHVYTRCNIGEMFPGACTPLSFSFTARGIDVGMQRMQVRVGVLPQVKREYRFVGMFYGHLFLNLSTTAETSTHALGGGTEQMALSICGRPLEDIEIRTSPPPALPRRILNSLRFVAYLLAQPVARRRLKALRAAPDLHALGRLPRTALGQWLTIDARFDAIFDAVDLHLISSASSGVLTTSLLSVIAKGAPPSEVHHAEVALLLAGAEGVESADIVAGVLRLQHAIRAHPEGLTRVRDATPEQALAWLRSERAGEAGSELRRYLERHGHRAVKELELRQLEWREDPLLIIKSVQAALSAAAQESGDRASDDSLPRNDSSPRADSSPRNDLALAERSLGIRILTRMARQAVRAREETKSGLVDVTTHFKRGYRQLARAMVAEGLLPDPDAVFFLTHAELGRLVRGEDRELWDRAIARRDVLDYQQSLVFEDVFVGAGEPIEASQAGELSGDVSTEGVTGAPVSRGRVIGPARIVTRLEDAESLRPGEILIAPITDVGWTPYFSLIAGLVTDIGSAVSHGAVVAREYGLPAVVNTRHATRVFRTGDRVLLDGERGIVRLAKPEDEA